MKYVTQNNVKLAIDNIKLLNIVLIIIIAINNLIDKINQYKIN